MDETAARIARVLTDPAVSDWLKSALRSALERDPVDAVNDALLLARVLDERVRELLRQELPRARSRLS